MTLSLAQQMAIPQGKSLSDAEMHDLLTRFMSTTSRYLPNGLTIITILTNEDLQKRF
jgi:hypothetical protein